MSIELPLRGIRVVDFTTLLPGPLATLLLRRAGAEVIKIEPAGGEAMRTLLGDDGAAFGLLNGGKRSVCADLKDPRQRDAVRALCGGADVVLEQFRPGVMDRLGLGYETLRDGHEDLVYCAITGYGQQGPNRALAGHDINYLADAGLFSLFRDDHGSPRPPPVQLADVVGGAYPAFSNILLALLQRLRSGRGAYLDIAMTRALAALSVSAVAAAGQYDRQADPLSGQAANYRCYRCADGAWLAVGALEPRFFSALCQALALPESVAAADPADAEVVDVLARRFAEQPASAWLRRLAGVDACCNVVRSLPEALATLADDGLRGLPLPLAPCFDRGDEVVPRPGEANDEFLQLETEPVEP